MFTSALMVLKSLPGNAISRIVIRRLLVSLTIGLSSTISCPARLLIGKKIVRGLTIKAGIFRGCLLNQTLYLSSTKDLTSK